MATRSKPTARTAGSEDSLPRGVVLRKLAAYLWEVKVPFSASLAFLVLIAGLNAVKAWIVQPVSDRFLEGGTTQRELVTFVLLVAGIFLLHGVAEWLHAILARVASARVIQNIRRDLFGHLTLQNLGYFSERQSSDLASRLVNDVSAFETAAVGSVQTLLRDALTVLFLLGVLLLRDWRVALSCIAIVGVAGVVLQVMSRKIQNVTLTVRQMVSQIQRQLAEMIGGIELIVGFGLRDAWSQRFDAVNQKLYSSQVRTTRTSASAVFLVKVIVTVGVCSVTFVAGRAMLRGVISIGDFLSFMAAMYLMQQPATAIGNSVAKMSRAMASAGRAFVILDERPTVFDPAEPTALPSGGLDLEFDQVDFLYKKETRVLSGLSFTVRAGELVAMVGASGAGKSTVAKLLMRFYDPTAGQVRLGGVPLSGLRRSDLYRHVAYVSQDIYLFDGSIEFNLRVGNPDASDAEIAEAIRIAGLAGDIAEFDHGLQTEAGERGMRLSGGQRQRIAIARAVLTDSSVLILDEATSALDMELEQRILQNLVDARRERTIFAVTHRLSLAEIADRVLVLKAGRLVQDGPATELVRDADGEFACLRRAADAQLARIAPTIG